MVRRLAIVLLWVCATIRAQAAEVLFAQTGQEVATPAMPDPAWDEEQAALGTLGASLNPRGRVRRVLYPMARSDAARGFRSFAGPRGMPRELVLVDALPFGSPAFVGALVADAGRKQRYLAFRNRDVSPRIDAYGIDSRWPMPERGVGAGLLWDLERLGARRLRVEYLDREGQPLSREALAALEAEEQGGPVPQRWRWKDVSVRVRFELEGEARQVLYVTHDVGAEPMPPLLSRFLAEGYDALFDKVSANGAGYAADKKMQPFVRAALGGLRRGGRIVTDSPTWAAARKAGLPIQKLSTKLPRFGRTAFTPQGPGPEMYRPIFSRATRPPSTRDARTPGYSRGRSP